MTPDEALDLLDRCYHSPAVNVVRAEVERLRSIINQPVPLSTWQKMEAELAAARAALRDLIGILEIAAVMPDAIHKHMRVKWDDPGLQRARAALAEGKK